ncbi:hypothetical protein [Lonsdalea quercina]|uniref:hypothetical protein n=1 Tax=Lonsdalea quercina TaxID=71657 RepID=UPI0039747469
MGKAVARGWRWPADAATVSAQLPVNVLLSVPKILNEAIHRTSKPDLAIDVAMEAAARGERRQPSLYR